MISETLRQLLKARRGEYNHRFQLARHLYPDLDGPAFLQFVEERIDPLMQALDERPGHALVFDTAYDLALQLHGKKLLGPQTLHPWIERGWECLFPPLALLALPAPQKILGSLANALHTLATTSGARPEEWIDSMEALGPRCEDGGTLLKLGQLLAWRCGLAHFREGALQAADTLPPELALAAVGGEGANSWEDLHAALLSNPWFDPQAPTAASGFRVVCQAGAFRGLGGLFLEPPQVRANTAHFVVQSGDAHWVLTADVFGATFHRASADEFTSAPVAHPDLEAVGSRLRWKDTWYEIPFGDGISSCAATSTTIALTSAVSHAVLLIALT